MGVLHVGAAAAADPGLTLSCPIIRSLLLLLLLLPGLAQGC
jgi:hypothetical protein